MINVLLLDVHNINNQNLISCLFTSKIISVFNTAETYVTPKMIYYVIPNNANNINKN